MGRHPLGSKRWVSRGLAGGLTTAVLLVVFTAALRIKGVDLRFWGRSAAASSADDLFCREHGVPEALCTLCHPELRKKLTWCQEHDIAEALCTLCHSELKERYATCAAHGLPTAFCAACGRADGGAGAGLDARDGALPVLRFASQRTATDVGFDCEAAHHSEHVPVVSCYGQVGYNENRYATVRPRLSGIVRRVEADAGTAVQAGDLLAVVEAPELGEAKADYLAKTALLELASAEVERVRPLAAREITARRHLVEAEAKYKEASIHAERAAGKLRNFGLTSEELARVLSTRSSDALLAIRAPWAGTLVHRRCVEGEAVAATSELFALADLATLWAHLDVYEKDLYSDGVISMRPGQRVEFQVAGLQGTFHGETTWVSPEVDARTRTIAVRAELDNSTGWLRANMFGKATVAVAARHDATSIPAVAVHAYEGAEIVFVRKSPDVFEPRRVALGHRFADRWEVTSGVAEGEMVVTTGSFLCKTELMRGAIGAGCCQ